MRRFALLNVLLGRLDLGARRVAAALLPEDPVDESGRYHPALRSGRSAWGAARVGDRWRRSWDALFGSTDSGGARPREVSGLHRSSADAQTEAAAASGRDAAA